MKLKTERVQFLVNVSVCYDADRKGDRAHMIQCAREDLLAVNTLPNEAKSARLVKKVDPLTISDVG